MDNVYMLRTQCPLDDVLTSISIADSLLATLQNRISFSAKVSWPDGQWALSGLSIDKELTV